VIAKLACCALLAGCVNAVDGARLPNKPDAGIDAEVSDATIAVDVPADADPCRNHRVVYLNFDGGTLQHAATSDATADEASWIGMSSGQTSGTIAMWRPNQGDRTQLMQDVTDGLQATFATISPTMKFVTTRPAQGPYVMIGFGGSMNDVGVPYSTAVAKLDCDDTVKSDVGWVFENVASTTAAINYAAGAIAFGLGATGTTDPNDCMCGWLTNCAASGNACTFSTNANAQIACTGETDPQNDVAIVEGFCD
jgi:hypothetical protein